MNSPNKLISSTEAAELLGIKKSTLFSWTSRRLIPYIRVSRNLIKFDPDELQTWLSARKIPALSPQTQKGGQAK